MKSDWIETALSKSVVRRAIAYAVVVGTILIAINHGYAILQCYLNPTSYLKMGLTVMVPYLVSTFSSVGAILQNRRL